MPRPPIQTRTQQATLLVALALLTAWATPHAVLAQQAYQELVSRYGQARLYHEAVPVPGVDGPVLVVPFRIPNSRLIFVRSEAAERPFTADVEVTVQVYRGGEKVAEEIWRCAHAAATFEETQRRDVDLQGMVQFALAPGRYAYRLLLRDAAPRSAAPLTPVEVPDFSAPTVGTGLVVESVATEDGGLRLVPTGLGGAVPYGAAARLAVPTVLPDAEGQGPVEVSYKLFLLDPAAVALEERERQAAVTRLGRAAPEGPPAVLPGRDAAALPAQPLWSGTLAVEAWHPIPATRPAASENALFWPAGTPGRAALAVIDPRSVTLEDGTYVLETTVRAGAWVHVAATRFETHWRDMPYSLYSPEVAIRNLAFIEERKTVRAMLRGSGEEREARIRAYWAERDPTPGTAFNELMAEYYRRIDHAAFAFKTGRYPIPDGLETDRARIYILHGPPDSIDRSVPPSGGVREVWQYAGGPRFTFWAAGSLDALELQEDRSR